MMEGFSTTTILESLACAREQRWPCFMSGQVSGTVDEKNEHVAPHRVSMRRVATHHTNMCGTE